MRSITTTELPRWFDLAKYEPLDQLDLDGWLINFAWRATYINALREDIQKYRDEIEDTFYEKNGKLYYKFKILRNSRLRLSILQDKISQIGKIKEYVREVNLNADRKRLWVNKILKIDNTQNNSMPISMNYFMKENI